VGWLITKEDIPYISTGAKFLSCGGGGETRSVECLLLSIMNEDDGIVVKSSVEMSNEWIVPVAVAGSTVLMNEDIPSGQEISKALKLYESASGRKTGALISMEIGGVNALIPLLAALECNLPVIDGDGMGRAFPEVEMTSFYHSEISAVPLVAVSKEHSLVVTSTKKLIDTFKDFTFQDYGYCHFACFGANGHHMKAAMIPGTLKLTRDIGKVLAQKASIWDKAKNIRHAFLNSVYGEMEIVFTGKIRSIRRWFVNKMLVGSATLTGQLQYHKKQADLYFQNEFLAFAIPEETACTTPDLIILLNYETGLPLSVSEIREGMLVMILAIKAPSLFHTKEMIDQTGPEPFRIPESFCHSTDANGRGLPHENWY